MKIALEIVGASCGIALILFVLLVRNFIRGEHGSTGSSR